MCIRDCYRMWEALLANYTGCIDIRLWTYAPVRPSQNMTRLLLTNGRASNGNFGARSLVPSHTPRLPALSHAARIITSIGFSVIWRFSSVCDGFVCNSSYSYWTNLIPSFLLRQLNLGVLASLTTISVFFMNYLCRNVTRISSSCSFRKGRWTILHGISTTRRCRGWIIWWDIQLRNHRAIERLQFSLDLADTLCSASALHFPIRRSIFYSNINR